uniref:Uncharacterized protein n=1 Tax=Romanomermis culicivorax TaxID=13658 RepID=A0A915K6D6_ROMCU
MKSSKSSIHFNSLTCKPGGSDCFNFSALSLSWMTNSDSQGRVKRSTESDFCNHPPMLFVFNKLLKRLLADTLASIAKKALAKTHIVFDVFKIGKAWRNFVYWSKIFCLDNLDGFLFKSSPVSWRTNSTIGTQHCQSYSKLSRLGQCGSYLLIGSDGLAPDLTSDQPLIVPLNIGAAQRMTISDIVLIGRSVARWNTAIVQMYGEALFQTIHSLFKRIKNRQPDAGITLKNKKLSNYTKPNSTNLNKL